MSDRIRVGTVHYTNSLPLTRHLDPVVVDLRGDHPRGISRALAAGDVDVGLVPVAAVLTDGDFEIIPGWCIGADGPVHSVLLVAETPPEEWTEVVFDGESRTSVTLAEILLRRGPLRARLSTDPLPLRTVAPGLGVETAKGSTAAVVIGDAARDLPERLEHRIDLAEAWKQWTGAPFVFAVWGAPPGADEQIVRLLQDAGRQGVDEIEAVYSGDDLVYLRDYIRYPLDDAALIGLRRYAALAFELGLVGSPHVRLRSPTAPARPKPDVTALLVEALNGASLDTDQLDALGRSAELTRVGLAAQMVRAKMTPVSEASYLPCMAWDGEGEGDVAIAGALESHAAAMWLPTPTPAAVRHVVAAGLQAWSPWVDDAEQRQALETAGLGAWQVSAGTTPVAHTSIPVHVVVSVSGDSPWRTLAQHLVAARAWSPVSVTVSLPLPEGSLVGSDNTSTAIWLRAVALARLALPGVHVVADPAGQGLDLSQTALHYGADDLGWVGSHGAHVASTARFEATIEAAERCLRAAGLEPRRRDLAFMTLGGAVTKFRRIRRPEERASR